MDSFITTTVLNSVWLSWVLWAVTGILMGYFANRGLGRRPGRVFDIIIGLVGGIIGGYLSLDYVGDTTMQRWIVSILSAMFFSGAALWIIGAIVQLCKRMKKS